MKLSVVILNYNVRWFLQQCLDSVRKALEGIDGEIIVVDNASPDDSVTMVKEKFPDVILLENSENSGFPKGNNIGVEKARGEFLCILNPDTVVPETLFHSLLAFVRKNQNAGITGVKLVDGTGKFLPESKRMLPTPGVSFARMSGLHKLFPKHFGAYYAPHVHSDGNGNVDVLVGAFMFMETALYRQSGGFDEQFFMYGEDIDLSYRIRLSGRRNLYFGGATVLHYKGESTLKDKTYFRRFSNAMILFYRKHFRVSKPLEVLYRSGILLFSLSKIRNQKKAAQRIPSQFLLVSDKRELSERIRLKTGKNVTQSDFESVKSLISQTFSQSGDAEILLDVHFLGYEAAITFLEQERDKGLTFKFLHPEEGYAIGSDSSEGRGNVLHF